MKVYISINRRNSDSGWVMIDCIGFFGWRKIVESLVDHVVQEDTKYSCRSALGKVASKEELLSRINDLPLKERLRIKYVIYPSEEQPDDYLYYDVLTINEDGQYEIKEQQSGASYMPYVCRKWLNDGENPDPKQTSDRLIFYSRDSSDDSYDEDNDDAEIYSAVTYELYHRHH